MESLRGQSARTGEQLSIVKVWILTSSFISLHCIPFERRQVSLMLLRLLCAHEAGFIDYEDTKLDTSLLRFLPLVYRESPLRRQRYGHFFTFCRAHSLDPHHAHAGNANLVLRSTGTVTYYRVHTPFDTMSLHSAHYHIHHSRWGAYLHSALSTVPECPGCSQLQYSDKMFCGLAC